MLHLVGVLLVSTGVAVASVKWSMRKTRGQAIANNVLNTDNPAQQLETSPSMPLTAVNAPTPVNRPEHTRGQYQLASSSGMLAMTTVAQFWLPALTPVSLVAIGYFAAHVFRAAYVALVQERRVNVDILDATGILSSLLLGQIVAAALMVWLIDLADWLLFKTRRQSRQHITNVFGEQIRYTWLLVNGQEIQTEVTALNSGDIIVVSTGEQIPVDGQVIYGNAMIDQHSLTGEFAPAEKHEGDTVFATTVLVAGKIQVQVQKTGQDTLASQIIQIINDASQHKVKLQSTGEHIADQMVVPTLGLGGIGYLLNGPSAMLAILNADFGTGIRIAAPIALLTSLGRAAKHGVLIKDSQVLETLQDIDVVLFDKTGTLTYDMPVVANIFSVDPQLYSEEQVLFYTATAEQRFSHPIAKAILQKAAQTQLVLPTHHESKYYVGLGVEVTLRRDLIKVGSARYMEREGILLTPELGEILQDIHDRGHTAILTAINRKMVGLIELHSTVRPEAVAVLQHIRQQGINEIDLISGDHDAPTRQLAQQLGVNRYFAGVLPNEKADYVKMLQAEGKKVMMVGDGINDSAALSYADIAVSLHGASTVAIDVADVVFMDGNLEKFNYLFEITADLQRNVKHSFYMVAIPNSICIAGGLTGMFGLTASLVLNNGFNMLAAVNGTMPYIDKSLENKATLRHDVAVERDMVA